MTALELMSKQEARRLTDEIKRDMESLFGKVREAFERRAWESLGYASWEGYCGAEFDTDHLKLPRDERPAIVASLRDAGMSTRAIAVATGLSKGTVGNDLNEARAQNWAPEITGTDGKTYQASRPKLAPETIELAGMVLSKPEEDDGSSAPAKQVIEYAEGCVVDDWAWAMWDTTKGDLSGVVHSRTVLANAKARRQVREFLEAQLRELDQLEETS